MVEMISSVDFTLLKIIGMIVSGLAGLIMSWMSKRSVNYRKIDKRMLLAAFLFFVYLQSISFFTGFVIGIAALFVEDIEFMSVMTLSLLMGVVHIAVFWGLLLRTKRMKEMMHRAKIAGRRLYLMIHWLSLASVVVGYIYTPYFLFEIRGFIPSLLIFLSWVITIWWFIPLIVFVWTTAKYVYSEMKITLTDGEIIQYSCSPQMCRVHKNYLRLLKRDENGVIIYERHINEASIKQIEYLQLEETKHEQPDNSGEELYQAIR